jgi:DNA-binding LacI/PurR family transcriptional regulator
MLLTMTDLAGPRPGPGNGKAPTISEVASLAGVSIATVSRVVSGTGRVGNATRLRVEQAIAATGWSASPAARLLAGGRGDEVVLALAVASPQEFAGDPYYARVVAGAQAEAAQLGLSLSVHVTRVGSVPALPPFGRKRQHVGAVLVNVDPWEATAVHDLGWPVISLGATTPDLPSVDPENEAGAADAVRHLLTRGRRRIATIAGPDRNPCARERLAGYRSAVRAAGLPEMVVSTDFTRPAAAAATRRLLDICPDLDAIFVASDLMATAVLQVLAAAGRRVSADVAVVGFDDSPPALMTVPTLSTVRVQVEQEAALAVRTLAGPLPGRPLDQRLPTQFVPRASSAA